GRRRGEHFRIDLERRAVRQDDRPFQDVFQLAHIPRPGIGLLPESWSSQYGSRRTRPKEEPMGKRRTREQIKQLLREAERDLAKGLAVGDFCRKAGISQTTYHRWKLRFSSVKVDEGRRVRELESEVERLK